MKYLSFINIPELQNNKKKLLQYQIDLKPIKYSAMRARKYLIYTDFFNERLKDYYNGEKLFF